MKKCAQDIGRLWCWCDISKKYNQKSIIYETLVIICGELTPFFAQGYYIITISRYSIDIVKVRFCDFTIIVNKKKCLAWTQEGYPISFNDFEFDVSPYF